MQLTKEQIKIAKAACKNNGINPKLVMPVIGDGFWAEKCNSSFDGYLTYLLTPYVSTGVLDAVLRQSLIDYRNGNAGASKLR